MVLLSLFVVNKSGGLIYQQNFSSKAPQLSGNDSLMCASTFVGLSLIAEQLCPQGSTQGGGIEVLEADGFTLHCLHPATGIKFIATAEPNTPNVNDLLKGVYELYGDYVMKNPFYEMEMPIKCELFSQHVTSFVAGN